MKKRKIAIFTGNRAEYGQQFPIMSAIAKEKSFQYYLFVSGAHLDEDFGYTKKEIEKDGFKVWREVKAEVKADSLLGTTHAIGHLIVNLSSELDKLKPDFLIVYADRFEGLAAVISGSQMGIPVVHIEGGDITQGGALDDYVRHAMTKLSHLHFTTNEEARERILKLGEEKWRVFNVGFPLIDLIKQGKFATPDEVVNKLKVELDKPIVLFTQHSITTEVSEVTKQLRPSLQALRNLAKEGIQMVVTYPNNDAGGRAVIKEIQKLKKVKNIKVVSHLGRYLYHGVLNVCGKYGLGVCVGNSSSGIKETPAFLCPFINIGSRQKGRLRSNNVLDVDYSKELIMKAVKRGLFDKKFRARIKTGKNPYGKGNSGKKVVKILKSIPLNKALIQKKITY